MSGVVYTIQVYILPQQKGLQCASVANHCIFRQNIVAQYFRDYKAKNVKLSHSQPPLPFFCYRHYTPQIWSRQFKLFQLFSVLGYYLWKTNGKLNPCTWFGCGDPPPPLLSSLMRSIRLRNLCLCWACAKGNYAYAQHALKELMLMLSMR